ncbi:signal peptidase I [Rubeoparvulum massiliense]|uniref:signal peptidase I n=1 Tax=Rubeoparvulum massiliense TaxID=1631346 RepID=UPI00065E495F|nr:signal peptidase I [Rubeoparvulum massiliense]
MENADSPKVKRGSKQKEFFFVLLMLTLAILFRIFIFSPYEVDGASMETTIHNHEKVMVNKWTYYWREPVHDEIIVFQANEKERYIKRVIGLPGDVIQIAHGDVYRNGEELEEPYLETLRSYYEDQGIPFTIYGNEQEEHTLIVPQGYLFVLGDNRRGSKDSRDPNVGFISINSVIGKAEVVIWPLTSIRPLH